jgi:predicted enzyme related to lactoylglutathione lyase
LPTQTRLAKKSNRSVRTHPIDGRSTVRLWHTGAMLRVGSININVSDMNRAAEFWSIALGYGIRGGSVNDDESTVLVPPEANCPAVTLDSDDGMHLDLYVESEEELVAEVDRLVGLGARQADWTYPDGAAFVVLTDTEGNLFCVANVGTRHHSAR